MTEPKPNENANEDKWQNVSEPPHRPYHVQYNEELETYRYKSPGQQWQVGTPPEWETGEPKDEEL